MASTITILLMMIAAINTGNATIFTVGVFYFVYRLGKYIQKQETNPFDD